MYFALNLSVNNVIIIFSPSVLLVIMKCSCPLAVGMSSSIARSPYPESVKHKKNGWIKFSAKYVLTIRWNYMSTKQEKVTDKRARASYFLLENMSSNISCWFEDIKEESK